jgi:hypothetical protein
MKLGDQFKDIPLEYTEQNFIQLKEAMDRLLTDGLAGVDAGLR